MVTTSTDFREQALRHDLAETAEADDQGGAMDAVKIVRLRQAGATAPGQHRIRE